MNKIRRKAIAKVKELVEIAKSDLENILWDEEDAFENMPDGLKESDRGAAMEEGIDELSEIIDGLDNIVDSLEEFVD